jgi:hypothetical protein
MAATTPGSQRPGVPEASASRYIEPTQVTLKEAAMATTKDYSGALFRNTKKDEGSPNLPDYTGDLLIAGARYRLAGWIKESKRGKFLSLSVEPEEEIAKTKSNPKKTLAADDDMPF